MQIHDLMTTFINSGQMHQRPDGGEKQNASVMKQSINTDTFLPSPLGLFSARSGLDSENSRVKREALSLHFNLNFTSASHLRVNAAGIFSEKAETLDISLSFSFEKEITVNGKTEIRTFHAELSFSAARYEKMSIQPYSKKENIMELIKRLVDSIWKTVGDPDKELAGIVFDKEDFKELAAVEEGKFVKELAALIQAIYFAARLMEMMHGESGDEKVMLHPVREKEEGVEINASRMEINDFRLSITEMTAKEEKAGDAEGAEKADMENQSASIFEKQPLTTASA